ncbi:MEMAR_RS02690 family S-layer glycoprotein, partial [Methanoregula sp.]|uniref:MEMAR_RS02690 family S-layer glycoprotein n=1 Tax=Methanoregula sp. TaxID=2052170 RepID=UPI002630930D
EPSYKAFTVDQLSFVGYTENWYLLGSDKSTPLVGTDGKPIVVFSVADPRLEIAVWDFQQDSDVTGKSVTQGQQLGFSIKTNMVFNPADGKRGNVSNAETAYGNFIDGYITIKVKDESGATMTRLANSTGTIPLDRQFIDTQPWYWPYNYNDGDNFCWKTDATDFNNQYTYPVGTYTIWAESVLNKMKDNYKNAGADYTGKTVSATATVTLVSDTVKIEANKEAVVRSKSFSVTVTGRPSESYYVWVKGTSTLDGSYDNQPPMIVENQDGVEMDSTPGPYTIGAYQFENGGGTTIKEDVSDDSGAGAFSSNGTRYYCSVLTDTDGIAVVEFLTTNWTKAQKYTMRVENQFGTMYKSDEVDINVEKGAVTIVAAGDQSYFLGEEIKFSGTNTEAYKTYLFIIGPNLESVGSQIQDPDPRDKKVKDGEPSTFKAVDVNGDNTWSWKWGTANYALDAGTYTIYAVSQARDKDNLANAAYGTVSIIIKKPFVSATASQSAVAKGDSIFITGSAEGDPGSVYVWILGKNYATQNSASVNTDSSFEYEIATDTTRDLTSGQYFVVVQHPMQNKAFDIDYDADNGYVFNRQLQAQGSTDPMNIFKLTGAGSLQGSDAAEALAEGINDANIDDTYTKLQFLVEEPDISIETIGDKHVGDKFTITAKTNLAVDDEILVQVYSSSFKPTMKSQSGEFSGASGTVTVAKGDSGHNTISFDVDSSTFRPDEYIVTEEAVLQSATGTALFNVLETTVRTMAPTTAATAVQTPDQTAVQTPVAPAVPTAAPTRSPGFGTLIVLIGLGVVAFVVANRK